MSSVYSNAPRTPRSDTQKCNGTTTLRRLRPIAKHLSSIWLAPYSFKESAAW